MRYSTRHPLTPRPKMTTQAIRNVLKKRLHEQLWVLIARRQRLTGHTKGTAVVLDTGHAVVSALQSGAALDILASTQPLDKAACDVLADVVTASVADHARAVSFSVEQALRVAAVGHSARAAVDETQPCAAAGAGPRELMLAFDGGFRPEQNRLARKVEAARQLCSRAARRAARRAEAKEARRAHVRTLVASVLPAVVRAAVVARLALLGERGELTPTGCGWVVRIVECKADADSHVRRDDFLKEYEVREERRIFIHVFFIFISFLFIFLRIYDSPRPTALFSIILIGPALPDCQRKRRRLGLDAL